MSENDDRTQWAMVPDSPELWASESGQIATLAPGGGFDILDQRPNADGKPYIIFTRGKEKTRGKRFVGRMVLTAFVERRARGTAITHADGDLGNCELANLSWRGMGEPAGNLTRRLCLGADCGVHFMSTGAQNRLCPHCGRRARESSHDFSDEVGSGGLPEDMLTGGGTYK